MSAATTCPKCGAALPASALDGHCAACLMKMGVENSTAIDGSAGLDSAAGDVDPRLTATIDHRPGSTPGDSQVERRLPNPGDRFGGYCIVRTLGKGGMGAVYEADQLDTGRRVALKVLKHSLDSPEARKRFLREGRLAAAVNHPNSVYVFGTEEINGTPAIAMELIAGGTLQERVKQLGPLPIGTAVDAVLQIIAGLEAAQKAGILHRDIKPANCFIDRDGSVKIGDFGLSISTGPRGDTDLTQAGTLLGTPAFSSPEQLRGDELNLRSDIYSVGVTLYYLLTGRTPFEADNMVRLLATVLEQPAPSPSKWRPEIPRPLAAVVLRCLEKQPASRFHDYEALRRALLPFASAAPSPATLGLRLVASVLDGCVMIVPSLILMSLTVGISATTSSMQREHGWLAAAALIVANSLLQVVYFGLFEGLWGRSPGKSLCRLRVVGPDRAAPGIRRATARGAILALAGTIPMVLSVLIPHPASADDIFDIVYPIVSCGPMLAMFLTARQSNGYAGLHDLATNTRVVSREVLQARPTLAPLDDLPPISAVQPQIGPYHILKPLGQADGEEWSLGYDARLLRRVWIHKLPSGSEPIASDRRGLGRIGRLRWLTGRRAPNENWDAYEAASGQPLLTLLDRPQTWRVVRFWLFDVAEELAAAAKDGTTPLRLALDCVWITGEGRAKLLDFPAPGGPSSPDEASQYSLTSGQFLKHMATAALEGKRVSLVETQTRAPLSPLPSSARKFVMSLTTLTDPDRSVGALREFTRQPPEASRIRRLWPVLACCFPVVLIGLFGLSILALLHYWQAKHPDLMRLSMYVESLKSLRLHAPPGRSLYPPLTGTPDELVALERYIAHRFRQTIQDPAIQTPPLAEIIGPETLKLMNDLVAAHPGVSDAEFEAARVIVEPISAGIEQAGTNLVDRRITFLSSSSTSGSRSVGFS